MNLHLVSSNPKPAKIMAMSSKPFSPTEQAHAFACQNLRGMSVHERRITVGDYARKTFKGWRIGGTYLNQTTEEKTLVGTVIAVRVKGNIIRLETDIVYPENGTRKGKLIAHISIDKLTAAFMAKNVLHEVLVESNQPYAANLHLYKPAPAMN